MQNDIPTIFEIVHSAAGMSYHPSGARVNCACNESFPIAEFEFHLFVQAAF